MSGGRLDPLQRTVLKTLASMSPRWTLTGGGALAGFHLGHRTTHDLDLFWHATSTLGERADEVGRRLRDSGLTVHTIQHDPSFARLGATHGAATLVIDLVAEPVPWIEAPTEVALDEVRIQIDTPHQILVNKLCALLSRSEVRDLVDLRALLGAGGDLPRALHDAPQKDGGFSPMTLAWVLDRFDVERLALSTGLPAPEAEALGAFRVSLVERLKGYVVSPPA
jgi:hypothetical protein